MSPQSNVQGDKLMIIETEENNKNRRTTYRRIEPPSAGTRAAVPHGGEGDRDANRAQGHIQLASESGLENR